MPDATTRYAKLQAGTCDLILFPNVADLAKMKTDPKVQLLEQKGLNVAYIAFNTEKAPFDNVKVRQALNYAVDKKRLLKRFIKVQEHQLKTHFLQQFGVITMKFKIIRTIQKKQNNF